MFYLSNPTLIKIPVVHIVLKLMMSHRLVIDVEVAMQLRDEIQPHGQLMTTIMALNVGLVA